MPSVRDRRGLWRTTEPATRASRMAGRPAARTFRAMATTIPPRVATFDVAYPDRPLDRLTSALRMFTIIPIAMTNPPSDIRLAVNPT